MTKTMTGMAATLVLAIGGAGCGSDDKAAESETGTPQQAITEIGVVRPALRHALDTYRGGDHAAAEREVGDAYLEHFEHVEGPLGKVDHELSEELEDAIAKDLRAKMKAGAPDAEVKRLVDDIEADLAKAEAALR